LEARAQKREQPPVRAHPLGPEIGLGVGPGRRLLSTRGEGAEEGGRVKPEEVRIGGHVTLLALVVDSTRG
jgi:hypothetical protein